MSELPLICITNLSPFFSTYPSTLLLSRLFGLKDIIIPGNCSSPYDLNLNPDHDWPVYVNPGMLFLLYITIAAVLKTGCQGTPKQVRTKWLHSASEKGFISFCHISELLKVNERINNWSQYCNLNIIEAWILKVFNWDLTTLQHRCAGNNLCHVTENLPGYKCCFKYNN